MKRLDIKWGIILGLVYLAWLLGSYFLGMHTDGIAKIQIVVLVNLVLILCTLILALQAIKNNEETLNFKEGVKSGAIISLIAGVIAMGAQVIYFQWVHPEFPEYMEEQTRAYYANLGVDEDAFPELLEEAENNFSLKSYMIQALGGQFLFGTIFSAMIMVFLRSRR